MNPAITHNVFEQIALRIIKEQELIIGPLAWNEASKVDGLAIANPQQNEAQVTVSGDPRIVINSLVSHYERLFGRLSREICKEAVADLTAEIPQDEVPTSLK
jgi:hypothetical protein